MKYPEHKSTDIVRRYSYSLKELGLRLGLTAPITHAYFGGCGETLYITTVEPHPEDARYAGNSHR